MMDRRLVKLFGLSVALALGVGSEQVDSLPDYSTRE